MNEKELLRRGMKSKGVTQEELAKKYGYTTQSSVGNILNHHTSMRVDVMTRFFDLLGYDIYVYDRETGDRLGKITSSITKPKAYKKATEEAEETKEEVKEEIKEVKIPVYQYGK